MGVTGQSVIKWPNIYVMLVSKPRLIMQVYQTHNATAFSYAGSEKMTARSAF